MIVKGLDVEVIQEAAGSNLRRNEPWGERNVKGDFMVGDAEMALKQVTFATTTGVASAAGISFQLCFREGESILAGVKEVSANEVNLEEKDSADGAVEV